MACKFYLRHSVRLSRKGLDEKVAPFPLWLHIVGLAIAFFGWTGASYLFGEARTEAKLSDSIVGGFIFTLLTAIIDFVMWGTMRKDRT